MGEAADRARAAVTYVGSLAQTGEPLGPSARVALHFHPDADVHGRSPLLQMIADGRYHSQFVTGTSNGGLTGLGRGDRWRWEQRIFGGVYDDAEPAERPVYGALLATEDSYGPAPRFGSAYLRLQAFVLARTTFAFPDSVFEPVAFGVSDRMGLLLPLLASSTTSDPLDQYVEAHVHGGVSLPDDVEALVLDPCYQGTALEAAARARGLNVEWHPGYALEPDTLAAHPEYPEYRGRDVVALGLRLASVGPLTPRTLGEARADSVDPQLLKKLWHCVAAFGRLDDIDPTAVTAR